MEITYQTAKLAGWSMLMVGNPAGLIFLGACSLITLKQLQQEYAPRLFSAFDSHSSRPAVSDKPRDYTFTYSYPSR